MLDSVARASLKSLRLAPATTSPTGTPPPSVSRLRLVPRLPRSVGLRPVFPPAQRRLDHRPVHGKPGPVDPDHLVRCRQPLAAGPQREEDGIHRSRVVHPWVVAPQRVGLARRQQQCDPRPQLIRNPPRIRRRHCCRHRIPPVRPASRLTGGIGNFAYQDRVFADRGGAGVDGTFQAEPRGCPARAGVHLRLGAAGAYCLSYGGAGRARRTPAGRLADASGERVTALTHPDIADARPRRAGCRWCRPG